jgi:hypothetical protein
MFSVNKMAMQKSTTLIVAAALVGTAVIALVAGLLSANQAFNNSANVKNIGVGVYWNKACTNKTTSINWGSLDPGGSKTFNVYIKNEGTIKESLSMATGNWSNPTAPTYITVTWNCTGYQLSNGAIVGALLTLTVSQSIVGTGITTFSFYMTITGTEV